MVGRGGTAIVVVLLEVVVGGIGALLSTPAEDMLWTPLVMMSFVAEATSSSSGASAFQERPPTVTRMSSNWTGDSTRFHYFHPHHSLFDTAAPVHEGVFATR